MSGIRPFTFDTDFDEPEFDPADLEDDADQEPEEPPPPTFSEEELEAARNEALHAGIEAGLEEALSRIEQTTSQAMEQLAGSAETLLADADRRTREMRRDTLDVAMAIARKLMPAAARRHALDEIEALISECLADLVDEPRLVIRVPEALQEPIRERAEAMARARGFEGRIVVIADPRLGDTDCRIEWAEGGAERDQDGLWQAIEAIAARLSGDGDEADQPPATTSSEPTLEKAPAG